jgi:thiol-disulfide isomerase/thioredoxin
MNKKYNLGFSSLAVVIILLVISLGGYATYHYVITGPSGEEIITDEMIPDEAIEGNNTLTGEEENNAMKGDFSRSNTSDTKSNTSDTKDGDGSITEDGESMTISYSGEVLAGDKAKFINFVKSDYDQAFKTDKLIVLYFYANWCPICKAELPKLYDAFNELNTDQVVGFRVSFNDNETDSDEKNLAREFGVAYQHTKVFLKNGQRIGKWPDSWNKDRYLEEINNAL